MSHFNFDTPLHKIYYRNLPKKEGRVIPDRTLGVELEIPVSSSFERPHLNGWYYEDEGSIEQGLELITRHPTTLKTWRNKLRTLETLLDELPPSVIEEAEDSYQCSTHIHVGVDDLNVRQVLNVMALWYLFEDYVVGTQNSARYTSAFCLRASSSKGLMSRFEDPMFLQTSEFYAWKYYALNWVSAVRLGTLEFRFLPLILDPKKLDFWVNFFVTFVEESKDKDITETLQEYYDTPILSFTKKNLPFYDILQKLRGKDIEASQSNRNLDLVWTLAKTRTQPIEPMILNEDVDEIQPSSPYLELTYGVYDEGDY